MKTLKLIAIAVLISLVHHAGAQEPRKEKIRISFASNMDCEGCRKKIEDNLSFEKGITDLDVDLEKNIITMEYKSWKTDSVTLRKAIEKLGYKAEILGNDHQIGVVKDKSSLPEPTKK